MGEPDEVGWYPVHQCAYQGYIKSLERCVEKDRDSLELQTQDDLSSTPFLLAVTSGIQDTVECLIKLGAKVDVINSQNHGAVEICAMKQLISMLRYFISLQLDKLPVWKNLLRMLGSDSEEEIQASATCLRILTDPSQDGVNPDWRQFYMAGGVPVVAKVIKSAIVDECKIPVVQLLLNMVQESEVQDQLVSSGGIPAFIKLLKSPNSFLIQLSATVLRDLATDREYADSEVQNNAVPALQKVLLSLHDHDASVSTMQSLHDHDFLIPALQAISNIAAAGPKQCSAVGNTQGCISAIVRLFEKATVPELMLALMQAVSMVSRDSPENQTTFANEGVAQHIVNVIMVQSRNKKLQESAVAAIQHLAEKNPLVQNALLDRGAERLLMQILKKRGTDTLQEKTAVALWALAGENINEKRTMANGIGVQTLVEFVSSLSEDLHLIGSEGLGVLAQKPQETFHLHDVLSLGLLLGDPHSLMVCLRWRAGGLAEGGETVRTSLAHTLDRPPSVGGWGPKSQQTQIATANGIHPLVRLLKCNKEHIVLSVIRSLRYLCVGVGSVPHPQNQNTISVSRGIKLLVALMVHSFSEIIQVEAAYTLGCIALGNNKIMEEIQDNVDFSYVRILRMLYSADEMVRLLAGSALASFAYNSLQQQREIAEHGGVRFHCFVPFLRSDNEFFRCNASYQVVVLARIIPDEEQATSSAVGIKLLVNILHDSSSEDIKAMAADYIASLAHTRAGVPSAIVAIHTVDYLCDMLLSESEQVRGNAAIALGYLSYNHTGERQLLNKCRNDPSLMREIKYYTKHGRLSLSFIEGWKHYQKVGLPPISEGRPSLVRARPQREDLRTVTMLSLEDTPSGSQLRGSASNLSLTHEGQGTGRSSRVSRESRGSRHTNLTMEASQLSLDTSRTRASIQDLVMVEEV